MPHENATPHEPGLAPETQTAWDDLAPNSADGQAVQPGHEADEPTTEREAYDRLMDTYDTVITQQFWATNKALEARGEPLIPTGQAETRPRFDVAFSEAVGQAVRDGSFPRIMPHMHEVRSTNLDMVRISPDIEATTSNGLATFNNDSGYISVSVAHKSELEGDHEAHVTELASFPANGNPITPQRALSIEGYGSLRQEMDAEISRINETFPDNPGNQPH
jgi:hypothetical protein